MIALIKIFLVCLSWRTEFNARSVLYGRFEAPAGSRGLYDLLMGQNDKLKALKRSAWRAARLSIKYNRKAAQRLHSTANPERDWNYCEDCESAGYWNSEALWLLSSIKKQRLEIETTIAEIHHCWYPEKVQA